MSYYSLPYLAALSKLNYLCLITYHFASTSVYVSGEGEVGVLVNRLRPVPIGGTDLDSDSGSGSGSCSGSFASTDLKTFAVDDRVKVLPESSKEVVVATTNAAATAVIEAELLKGYIVKINPSGTFSVLCDNGEMLLRVSAARLRKKIKSRSANAGGGSSGISGISGAQNNSFSARKERRKKFAIFLKNLLEEEKRNASQKGYFGVGAKEIKQIPEDEQEEFHKYCAEIAKRSQKENIQVLLERGSRNQYVRRNVTNAVLLLYFMAFYLVYYGSNCKSQLLKPSRYSKIFYNFIFRIFNTTFIANPFHLFSPSNQFNATDIAGKSLLGGSSNDRQVKLKHAKIAKVLLDDISKQQKSKGRSIQGSLDLMKAFAENTGSFVDDVVLLYLHRYSPLYYRYTPLYITVHSQYTDIHRCTSLYTRYTLLYTALIHYY